MVRVRGMMADVGSLDQVSHALTPTLSRRERGTLSALSPLATLGVAAA